MNKVKPQTAKQVKSQMISSGLELKKLKNEIENLKSQDVSKGVIKMKKAKYRTVKKNYKALKEQYFEKWLDKNWYKIREKAIQDKLADYISGHLYEELTEDEIDRKERQIAEHITDKQIELMGREIFESGGLEK